MNNPTGQIPEQGEGVDPSEVADTRTIEQKLEDWAHDLAHSRVFNGAAPVCREAAALIADLRQTCADQGAAYMALAERLRASSEGEARFAAAVAAEVARARAKFPGADHMYGALAEEVGEVAKSLLEEHDRGDLRAECVQVAAMAQRLAEEGDNDYPASLPASEGEGETS